MPHLDSVDDTSYFVSRFTDSFTARDNDQNTSDSDSDTTDSFLNSEGCEVNVLPDLDSICNDFVHIS